MGFENPLGLSCEQTQWVSKTRWVSSWVSNIGMLRQLGVPVTIGRDAVAENQSVAKVMLLEMAEDLCCIANQRRRST